MDSDARPNRRTNLSWRRYARSKKSNPLVAPKKSGVIWKEKRARERRKKNYGGGLREKLEIVLKRKRAYAPKKKPAIVPKSRPVCRRKRKRGKKPKPKLVNAPNSKLAFALKLKRRFAPRKPSAERPTKLLAVAPSTNESWLKKLQRPNNSANTFSNLSDRRVPEPGAIAMGPGLRSSKSNQPKPKSPPRKQRYLPKLPRSPNGSTLA